MRLLLLGKVVLYSKVVLYCTPLPEGHDDPLDYFVRAT